MGKVIGLTGPTGAGKTTVCLALEKMGAHIVDCDVLARKAVEIPSCLAALQEAFGEDIAENGVLNRRLLARRAFQSDEKTALLNSIVHPAVIALALEEIKQHADQVCVIDAPLLFQAGMETLCDCTVAVLAPASVRLERIMKRDGIGEKDARMRMRRQPGQAWYRERADAVISGVSADPEAEARRVLKRLQVMI